MDREANAVSAEVKTPIEHHAAAPATSKADGEGNEQASSSNVQTMTFKEKYPIMKKRECAIKEFIESEKSYVFDLLIIVEGYIRHFLDIPNDPPQPEALKDRRYMIFGNIEVIFEWHRDEFLGDLKKCVKRPELLGPLFRRFLEQQMSSYEAYCRNKFVSEGIVSEYDNYFRETRIRLGQKKLELAEYLIRPIQRIQKYHTFVKQILTLSEQVQSPAHMLASLHDAVACTDIFSKNANSMLDVGRLQGFTGNIADQGKLILQDTVNITDLCEQSREREMRLFLFEQCIIFTDPVCKEGPSTSPTFNYVSHIELNEMNLEKVPCTPAFRLISAEHDQRKRQSYFCRPKTDERHKKLLGAINDLLKSQLNLAALELEDDPEYQDSDSDFESYSDSDEDEDEEAELKKFEEEKVFDLEAAYYDFLLEHVFFPPKGGNIPQELSIRAKLDFALVRPGLDEAD